MRGQFDSLVLLNRIREITRTVESSVPGENLTRKLVSDIPEWCSRGFDFEIAMKGNLKLKDKIALAIYRWETNIRFLKTFLGMYLEESAMQGLEDSDQFLLGIFLENQAQTVMFLQETQLWSVSSFFGGIYTEERLENLLQKIRFRINKMPKPKYSERHRGYRDKGSRRLAHEKHEDYQNDYSSIQLQLEIESRRDKIRDTLQFYLSDTYAR